MLHKLLSVFLFLLFAGVSVAAETLGALPGDYAVLIEKTSATGGADGGNPTVTLLMPERYARRNTTPLKASVEKRSKNYFTFEIETK